MNTCQFCDRELEFLGGLWIDPGATGDDMVWRETCDASNSFGANHEPKKVDNNETKPAHLSAEYWAKCLEVRDYLLTTLDGLVLGVGAREPETEADPELMLFIAPNDASGGVILYEWEWERFVVLDRPQYSLSDFYAVIRTLGRPAAQVSELLRAAVGMLDLVE